VFDGGAPEAGDKHKTGEADARASLRRAEDETALAGWPVRRISLGFPDASVRHDDGQPRYRSSLSLRRPPKPADAPLVGAVARALAPILAHADEVIAPLGRATHVDHHITRTAVDAALRSTPATVRYYSEFPYAPPEPRDLVRTEHPADFHAWLRASLLYRSQVNAMFGGPISFGRSLARHANVSAHGHATWSQWHVASVRLEAVDDA
jgi:LmbE family N-acetylglucosaminyl deacetylase